MLKASFENKASRPALVILLFSLLSVFLRLFSFIPSVIDHDESTYLEISRQLLAGRTLYVDMIDIKPPGIFLILAGFQAVFGHSIFVIRLMVALWIAVTAFMVYKAGRIIIKDDRAAFAAGIIYIFLISTWSFYGISTTPEIFFNLFTIASLYILLKYHATWKYLLAGLLAGMGFLVKYFVLFDFSVFVIFFLIQDYFRKGYPLPGIQITVSLVMAGIGLLIPFGVANLIYFINGSFDAFYNLIYLAPGRYASEITPGKMLKFILDFQFRFLPVFFLFYYMLFKKQPAFPAISLLKKLVIPWSVMNLIAVIISGNHYGHYTIQLMLPVSLMAGAFFHPGIQLPKFIQWITSRQTGTIILTGLIILVAALKLEYVFRHDIPREIAAYIEPRLKPEDVIYTGNYHHVLYYLLKKDSPTPYIHRTLLIDERHIHALDIDARKEFKRIIDQRPVFIITEKEYPPGIMKDFIFQNYSVEKEFGKEIKIYRLKGN